MLDLYEWKLPVTFYFALEFQNQDHYAVLGLGSLRYKATDAQIKKACECLEFV